MANSKVWMYESNTNDALAKQVYKDNSIVMTSPLMALDLIALIPLIYGDAIIEPCKGTGPFYNNFPNNTTNMVRDIHEGIDYLDFTSDIDYTVSTPPLVPRKLFGSFRCKAMETTRTAIYWLINMAYLNIFTPKRYNEMNSKGWYSNNVHIVNDKTYGLVDMCG